MILPDEKKRQPPKLFLSYYFSGRIHRFFRKSTLYINSCSSSRFEQIHWKTFQWIVDICTAFLRHKKLGRSIAYLCRTNLFIEFPQFWKKNRHSWSLTNSSKTFLNQWEPMGFHKLQWMILPAWRASNISSLIWQLGSKWFFMRSNFIGTMLRFPLKPPFNISENFVFEETLILTNWTVCWTTLILLMVGENPIFNICMRKQAKLASN